MFAIIIRLCKYLLTVAAVHLVLRLLYDSRKVCKTVYGFSGREALLNILILFPFLFTTNQGPYLLLEMQVFGE
jgi:hypothetical protein